MSDQFLRLVSRSTKFDKQLNATPHTQLDFFAKKSSQSTQPSSAAAAVALDFFGAKSAPVAASSSSSSSSSTNGKKHGTKRVRDADEDEDENDNDAEGEDGNDGAMIDDGENDLDNDEEQKDDDDEEDDEENQNEEGQQMDDDGDESDADGTPLTAVKRLKQLRRAGGIHVQGSDIPPPISSFADLPIPQYMIDNLQRPVAGGGCGYEQPTPIQQQAIPILLKGRELLACAPTGSGKTAAFVVPILAALKNPASSSTGFRALILAPTRELSEQTQRSFTTISRGRKWKIFHLSKSNANENVFGKNVAMKRDILIATPMRLVHLIENGAIDLSHVEYIVLDEADRLFELGFLEQIDTILSACSNTQLKRVLFSATMMQGVETLARTVLHDPIRLTVGARNSATDSIKQELIFVSTEEGKLIAFRQMMQSGLDIPVLVFVQSKERAKQLYGELVYDNLNVDVIHAERTQHQRSESIKKFRAGTVWVLICTDLMGRGIDFIGVNTVINYDFPQSTVSYIHRIGRTGRAGRKGRAITFFTESDKPLLHSIAKLVQQSGNPVPEWMLQMKKIGQKKAKRLIDVAPPRQAIVPGASAKKQEANKKARDRKKKRKLAGGGEATAASATK